MVVKVQSLNIDSRLTLLHTADARYNAKYETNQWYLALQYAINFYVLDLYYLEKRELFAPHLREFRFP